MTLGKSHYLLPPCQQLAITHFIVNIPKVSVSFSCKAGYTHLMAVNYTDILSFIIIFKPFPNLSEHKSEEDCEENSLHGNQHLNSH